MGVQVAQGLGVCVHLLGIYPARGSQSPSLRQEADTTGEWDAATIARFLSLVEGDVAPLAPPDGSGETADANARIERFAREFADGLRPDQVALMDAAAPNDIPVEIHGRLLAGCGRRLDRRLVGREKNILKTTFLAAFHGRQRSSEQPPPDPTQGL
ncbi:MAG TPA: hypothetical protein VFC47_05065 [Caulobacteraceae bacterium]|nr:hypothetical protein [Caulobacteraceae bacterium]